MSRRAMASRLNRRQGTSSPTALACSVDAVRVVSPGRLAVTGRAYVPAGWSAIRNASAQLQRESRASFATTTPPGAPKTRLDVRLFGHAGAPLKACVDRRRGHGHREERRDPRTGGATGVGRCAASRPTRPTRRHAICARRRRQLGVAGRVVSAGERAQSPQNSDAVEQLTTTRGGAGSREPRTPCRAFGAY